jgi:hypothetical protein
MAFLVSARKMMQATTTFIIVFTEGSGKDQNAGKPFLQIEGRTMRSVNVGPAGVWAVAKVRESTKPPCTIVPLLDASFDLLCRVCR